MKEKRKSIEDRERRAAHVHGPVIPRGPRVQKDGPRGEDGRAAQAVAGRPAKVFPNRPDVAELIALAVTAEKHEASHEPGRAHERGAAPECCPSKTKRQEDELYWLDRYEILLQRHEAMWQKVVAAHLARMARADGR